MCYLPLASSWGSIVEVLTLNFLLHSLILEKELMKTKEIAMNDES